MATWHPVDTAIGFQPIETTETTQKHPEGTMTKARSDTYGVAMSANIANQWGWYCIGGAVPVLAPNAMAAGAEVFMLAATPGSVDDAVVASEQIVGAWVSTTTGTPSTGLGVVNLNRPFLQGRIT
jgi:hypothetical protein